MGFGDEIMAAAEARALYEQNGLRVGITDKNGAVRSHPLWNGLDYIAQGNGSVGNNERIQLMNNGPGCRPYVDYLFTDKTQWAYTDWRCRPGEIALTPQEIAWANEATGGSIEYFIIEPHIKPRASPNKRWPFENFQAVIDAMVHWPFVQMRCDDQPLLAGVREIRPPDFRHACAVLKGARGALLPEGGLHHAAAALGVPAVVIFGAMTSPANTGYDDHINLFVPDTLANESGPCGWRVPCRHCEMAMAMITPAVVTKHCMETFY